MVTVKEIAEKTGKSAKAVYKILGRHGFKPVGRSPRGEKLFESSAVEAARRSDRGVRMYYKVSVMNPYRQWIVKAVCLTKKDSGLISDELNALGITARASSHLKERKRK